MHYNHHILWLYNWEGSNNMNLSTKQEATCEIFGTIFSVDYFNDQSEWFINHTFVLVLNSILIIPTILLNGLSIITIINSHQLKSKPCYFTILVQSVIDLAVGVLAMPLYLTFMKSDISGISNCVFFATLINRLFLVPIVLSSTTLFVMTLERYIAVLHPYAYSTQATKKKLLGFVVAGSVIDFSVMSASLAFPNLTNVYAISKQTLVFLFIAIAYTRIFVVVRRLSHSQNRPHDAFSKRNLTRMKLFVREVKGARSCFIVVICFCTLAFMPVAFMSPFLPSRSRSEQSTMMAWAITAAFANSSANSVIFFWTKTMLRKEAITKLKRVCLHQHS